MTPRQKLDQAIAEYAAFMDEDNDLVSVTWVLGWESTHYAPTEEHPVTYRNSYAISDAGSPTTAYGTAIVLTEMLAETVGGDAE